MNINDFNRGLAGNMQGAMAQNAKPKSGSAVARSQESPVDSATGKVDRAAFSEFLHSKIDEAYENVKNGNPGRSYGIGGQEFTEDEWDKLMEGVDDQEDELRRQVEEELSRNEVKAAMKAEENEES